MARLVSYEDSFPEGNTGSVAPHPYDSRPDTWAHIDRVRSLLNAVVNNLIHRADEHDRSKLVEPELSVFNEFTPKLADAEYGSDEYQQFLVGMKPALDHHYSHNSHHPEFHARGIRGMSLLDAVEMLCDWKASTERVANGDLRRSIELNQMRFGYSDEFRDLLLNTAVELGYIDP